MIPHKYIPGLLALGICCVVTAASRAGQQAPPDTLKAATTKPFEVKLTYDVYDCGGQLTGMAPINGQPPFFWYELDSLGKRVSNETWVNPKLQQLRDKTLYLVEDAWQRRDTIYISFEQTVEFYGLHPNPFKENFAILYQADLALPVQVAIFDLTGKLIDERNFMLEPEKKLLYFNPVQWPRGTYIVKLKSRCFSQTMKVVYMGR